MPSAALHVVIDGGESWHCLHDRWSGGYNRQIAWESHLPFRTRNVALMSELDQEPDLPGQLHLREGRVDPLLDEDLPPVEPPSAGFIVQLFLVPGVIVMVVVGLWALFGKLASSETDWRELVVDLQSENTHRRDRGAHGLAQLLVADQHRGSAGERLARNPKIAQAMVGLFETELQKSSPKTEEVQHQVFLSRTLGLLEVHPTVIPALLKGIAADRDAEIRKSSLMSIALVASRTGEGEAKPSSPAGMTTLLAVPSLLDDLIETSEDETATIVHLATYALGLLPCDASREQLELLLKSGNSMTRVNAAIALTRQKSKAGLPTFRKRLKQAARDQDPEDAPGDTAEERRKNQGERNFEEFVVLKNTLQAVSDLNPELTAAERAEFIDLITPIAESYREPRIGIEAEQALQVLQAEK